MSRHAQSQSESLQNSNKYSTKQLVVMALMCAISILLSFFEFPIIPTAAFLKLDIALVPSSVIGFAYGPGSGLLVGFACAVAHAAITGNWVGAIMNCIAALAFILPSALIYKHIRVFKGAVLGLVSGAICLILAQIVANLVIDPLLYGMPFQAVVGLVIPAILPFNAIKGTVIAIITGAVYKVVSNLITLEKDQVKGR